MLVFALYSVQRPINVENERKVENGGHLSGCALTNVAIIRTDHAHPQCFEQQQPSYFTISVWFHVYFASVERIILALPIPTPP